LYPMFCMRFLSWWRTDTWGRFTVPHHSLSASDDTFLNFLIFKLKRGWWGTVKRSPQIIFRPDVTLLILSCWGLLHRGQSSVFCEPFLIKNYFFIINGWWGTDECPPSSISPPSLALHYSIDSNLHINYSREIAHNPCIINYNLILKLKKKSALHIEHCMDI
jgi:hypothetical protein